MKPLIKRAEQELFAKKVIQFYKCHSRKDTINYFIQEGIHRTSLYRILKRFDQTGKYNYRPIPGGPRTASTPRNIDRVKSIFEQSPSTSVKVVASELNISISTVARMKRDLGIKSFSNLSAPQYVNYEKERVKRDRRKVYSAKNVLIIDNVTYLVVDSGDVADIDGDSDTDSCYESNVEQQLVRVKNELEQFACETDICPGNTERGLVRVKEEPGCVEAVTMEVELGPEQLQPQDILYSLKTERHAQDIGVTQ